jgi:fumarate reductase subunit D
MSLPNSNEPQVKKDIEENKVLAAIGYINILCLVPLFLKPKSEFCKFHGKQGLILFIAWIITCVLNVIPLLGQLIFVIGSLAIFLLSVLGIIKALSGEYWEMPYVAEYAKKINI